MTSRRPSSAGTLLDLPLPPHISTLASKVLAGDTDAMQLLGTPVDELLVRADHMAAAHIMRNATAKIEAEAEAEVSSRLLPPTAIRAEFYSYTFSSWDGLWKEGRWWDRQLLSRPVIIEQAAGASPVSTGGAAPGGGRGKGRGRDAEVRRSTWQRHWLMMGSVLGVHLAARSLLTSTRVGVVATEEGLGVMRKGVCMRALRLLNPLTSLVAYSAVGALALTSDYPRSPPATWLSSAGLERGYAGVSQLRAAAIAMAVAELGIMALTGQVGRRREQAREAERPACDVAGVSSALLSVLQYVVLPLALGALAQQAEAWHAQLQVG